MDHIGPFVEEYRFLSNFWPCQIRVAKLIFPSVENAYQAMKSEDVDDWRRFVDVSPSQAKRMAKSLKLRPDWDEAKRPIMERLIDKKFRPGTELGNRLIATYPKELVEINWWGDRYWGRCNGVGHNWLGVILMARRLVIMEM